MLRSPPRYSSPSLPPLDESDRKLIDALMRDGRASGRELAQQTGISEANVSRRLARLIEERSIRILGFVPPECLGLQVQFETYLHVKGDVDSIAQDLLRHPEFSFIQSSFGAWNLVLFGVVSDSRALVDLLDRTVISHPFVHAAETCTVLELPDQPQVPPATQRDLDHTDRLIIRQLQADGRMSFTDIATNTGISATSAADRFRRLVADGVVRIMTLPDPTRIGLHLSGLAQLQLDRPTREVVQELRAFPELDFLTIMSGAFPVGCEFYVRDGMHFDSLRAKLLAIRGVRDIRLMVHRKLYRQTFEWGTVGVEAPTQAAAR